MMMMPMMMAGLLTEVYNNDPALHKCDDPPALRNLVEYLRAR
jgi:hypothetical protein